jgi:hypothetical protein
MWERLNPEWNVDVYDIDRAKAAICEDIPLHVFETLRAPAQADVLRTKLLSTYGGIWLDASCLPHMPISHWIDEFEDTDLSALPTGAPGRTIASWFLISKKSGLLLSKQYELITKYWQESKMYLPQDRSAIAMMEENWREYISDYAAYTLRIVPYFWWHNIFSRQIEIDSEFSARFKEQKFISKRGGSGVVNDTLKANSGKNVPLSAELRNFLATTDVQVSKLHHRVAIDYPFDDLRMCLLDRASAGRPAAPIAKGNQ